MAAPPSDEAFWAHDDSIFDFTLKFEDIILSISLSSIFSVGCVFFFCYFYLQPLYVGRSFVLFTKLGIAATLVAVRATLLAYAITISGHSGATASAAGATDLLAAIFVVVWISLEHGHSLRSSSIFTLYLFAGVLADTTKSRSFFLRHGLAIPGGLESAAATLQVCLICLQEVSKRAHILDATLRDSLGEEATSGPLSRLFFLFLRRIFATGFDEELSMNDLGQMDAGFSPGLLYQQIMKCWRPRQNCKTAASRELAKACLRAWKRYLLPMLAARSVVTALNFAQPFLLRQVIMMVGEQNTKSQDMAHRGGILGASIFIFYGLPLARTTYSHLLNRYITRVRGGIISLLFHKIHRLTETEAKKAAVASLMTADIEGITSGIQDFIEIPFGVIELALGIYVLYQFVEFVAFTVFGPVVVFTILTHFLSQKVGTLQAGWNESIADRIRKTSHILPQLTSIKMLGLGPTIGAFLRGLRVEEVRISRGFRLAEAISMVPVLLADLMTPVLVIAAALFGSAFHGEMEAVHVFPVLTAVVLIQTPLARVLDTYPTVTGMLACFSRVESFLCTSERKDPRVHLASSNVSSGHESLVCFHNADIAKLGMKEPLLRGLNFQLPPGSLSTIIGRTGSGKSSLVEAILGESEVLAGTVKVDTSNIGYCSQNAWLRDTTIRENIIGLEEYDEARFARVVRACFLEEDFTWLPGGAEYVVGTNGQNLSGGQRQRVALARTAYQAKKLTILDDALSSLDRHTAITVLHQLCGRNGMLREAGCTVVLVTYLPECLNLSNNLLIITRTKQVVMTPAAIRGTQFADEVASILNSNNVSVRAAVENEEQNVIRRSLQHQAAPTRASNDSGSRTTRPVYRPLFALVGRLSAMRFVLLLILFGTAETLPEVYIRLWIELHPRETLYFLGYAGIVFAASLLGAVCHWILHARLSPRCSVGFHDALVNTTMGATLSYLSATKTGVYLNLYNQDLLVVSKTLPAAIFRTLYAGTAGTIQIVVIMSGASFLSLILPFVLVGGYFIQRYYLRTSCQVRLLDLEAKTPLYTYFEETIAGLSHLHAVRWVAKNIERGFCLLEESQKPYYVLFAIQQWLALILGLMSGTVGVVLFALALYVKEGSTESSIGLSFVGLLAVARIIEATIMAWTSTQTSTGAVSRLLEFEATTPQEVTASEQELPERWPSGGAIEFKEVTARYRPDSEDAPALDDITMSIASGQRIGVSGRSGSGKSSIFRTLLGFIHYQGMIEIDGINIASISRDQLRSRLVTITQDLVQFQGTVRMNLLPLTMNVVKELSVEDEEKASKKDMELEQLLKTLRIWAQLTSKGGLDAILEDVGYSKGELQLLCIARAILKQRETGSKLVLVDEATSSVDAETEKAVNAAMKENFVGCTILTIAHRRSGLRNVEGVVDMYHGSIIGYEALQSEEDILPDSDASSN
ncbi:hypothetical protein NLG97_g2075 [Lecanicillium saksenae]|uniref:Uncharacterized protein n=1 Tax=Lecanicillium saksenae TaxID=468837 RepID=A0ACC1R5Z8_9HYPO|nr:hypothetical protein NLG97_g2075 [Lecanicillium saksenae]